MTDRFSFRKKFNALVAAAVFGLGAAFSHAAEPLKKPKAVAAQKHVVKKKAPVKKQAVAAPVAKQAPKPQALKKTFVPNSPTGESCPDPNRETKIQWTNPVFDVSAREQQQYLSQLGMAIGRNNPDGFFNERATQSVNEFRLLNSQEPFRESMTGKNLNDLKTFSTQVKSDRQVHALDLDDAVALRLAANSTGISVARLAEQQRAGFKPDTATWLYLIDTYGRKYGLSFYADKITLTTDGDGTSLFVKDPVIFEQILDLQKQPRIMAVMMAESLKKKETVTASQELASPVIAVQQGYLETLGFDIGGEGRSGVAGALTAAALLKFDKIYTPAFSYFGEEVQEKSRAAYLQLFSEQAKKDAEAYRISTTAAAAIRLANIRTGADFGYMMELSSAESSFDHEAKASTSSATGLYQFTEDTWLHMIKRYGERYGMKDLADQVEAKGNMYGVLVARVENPFVRSALLELRRDPHIAALMSAEFQMRNTFMVECAVGHELNRTEQYLAHFLGSKGAAHFLNKMAENQNQNGVRLFPTAAAANKSIFYSRDKKGRLLPRTLKQIYNTLDKKFETGSYEDTGVKVKASILQGDQPESVTPPTPLQSPLPQPPSP